MALMEAALPEDDGSGARRIELDVTGMSCRACSGRVQRTLNKIDGVHASVNLGARVATIDASPDVSVAELCAAVQKAGYSATQRAEGATGSVVVDTGGQRNMLSRLISMVFGH
jgi:cation transport ATPase